MRQSLSSSSRVVGAGRAFFGTRSAAVCSEIKSNASPPAVASEVVPSIAADLAKYRFDLPLPNSFGPGGRMSISGIRAVVFGSTGFLGRYVVNRLGRIGSHVITPYRGEDTDAKHLRQMGDLGQIVPLPFDPKSAESVQSMLQSANIVINLVGRNYETKNYTFDDVHVGVASLIARAAQQQNLPLIHLSALGADAASPSRLLQSKYRGEQAVKAIHQTATIIRPSVMVGDEDYFLRRYAHMSKMLPIVPLPHNGRSRRQPVHVVDVARAVINCAIDSAGTAAQTFEAAGDDVATIREWVDKMYGITHRPNKAIGLPLQLVNLWASLAEQAPHPLVTRDAVLMDSVDILATPGAKGLRELDIDPTPINILTLERHLRAFRSPFHWSESQLDQHKALQKQQHGRAHTVATTH